MSPKRLAYSTLKLHQSHFLAKKREQILDFRKIKFELQEKKYR